MNRTILVVDTSQAVRAAASINLGPKGFTIVEARDGAEALAQLEQQLRVDLVLCDLNTRCGPELLKYLYRLPTQVPVIVISTEYEPAKLARAKFFGVRNWLQKPLKPEAVVETIRRLI